MLEWLKILVEYTTAGINAMALAVIAIGTVKVFIECVAAIVKGSATDQELRDGYLHYARWLIAGLTFQLAADIIETMVAPTWDDVGRLAAIAFIRTFLSYFLERDVMEVRELRLDQEKKPTRSKSHGD